MESTQQIVNWIGSNVWIVVIGALSLIEIAPIKIDPWKTLFKWIGNQLLGETKKTIDDLRKEVKDNEKDRIRWEILDFANSCRNGRRHSRDEFKHIIELDSKYRKLLSETDDTNGVFDIEIEYIKELYRERLERNDFLA